MSHSFTIVPTEFMRAMQELLRIVTMDPAVIVAVEGVTSLYFAGDKAVASRVARGEGLASLRLLGHGVFQLDTDGYGASAEQAARYVRRTLATFECRVFDDETGEELTFATRTDPGILFAR